MKKRELGSIILGLLLTLIIIFLAFLFWAYGLNTEIKSRLQGRRFSPPIEFYSAPDHIFRGQKLSLRQIPLSLGRLGYKEKKGVQIIPGQFSVLPPAECLSLLPPEMADTIGQCVYMKRKRKFGSSLTADPEIIVIGPDQIVVDVLSGNPTKSVSAMELEAELFAQFVGNEPILRTELQLGESPPSCLNAVLAIEDSDFLNHSGVSVTGLLRAFFVNVFKGRLSQGGSTITQQLVKNYFLTSERTLRRKFKEIVMSILLEAQATKDEILETYINEIYMGQNGVFQVRGYGAASQHYFNKNLDEADLAECALLAAIVNSPGRFNPFTNAENATKRRNRVLEKMLQLKLISEEEAKDARAKPLPSVPHRVLSEPAPYFVDAVRTELEKRSINTESGLKVFTTLNQRAQEAANHAVVKGLEALETRMAIQAKAKKKKDQAEKPITKHLEAVLIGVDALTGQVQALMGGRSFRASQYNRATKSRRQVGSVMKPLVYLTALEANTEEGKPYSPITVINDEKSKFKYEGQTWEPENYEKKYFGPIPLFFGLKNSLNAATAVLGVSVGLDSIVDTARRLGVSSKMQALPALTLGAFEMSPWEVAQIYTTFARLGVSSDLTIINRLEDLDGKTLFQQEYKPVPVAAPETVASLVGMMKQTIVSGTARSIPRFGFTHPAAGKTGTTSDMKDAWFAGFTPFHVAIVWIGYDDATPHGLTGASGAVPLWADYMNQYGSQFPPQDFPWPDSTVPVQFSAEAQDAMNLPKEENSPREPFELIFRKGTEPR